MSQTKVTIKNTSLIPFQVFDKDVGYLETLDQYNLVFLVGNGPVELQH